MFSRKCSWVQTPISVAWYRRGLVSVGGMSGSSDLKKQHSSDYKLQNGSFQFSYSVVSDSLRPYGLPHARLPCPLPTPGTYSNSCPLSWWCHPAISSTLFPFSSSLQSFPASGSFQMSQFYTSGSQSIGVSASASVFPVNIQDWFPSEWTVWISLPSKGLARVFSNKQFKSTNYSALSFLYSPTLTSTHDNRKKLRFD